jgi:hypothetical protein
VIRFLMKRTMEGVKQEAERPLEHILKFIPFLGAGREQ